MIRATTKVDRQAYAKWVLARHQPTLDRFAYTDGTTFYLARTWPEKADKNRAALGKCVWRMTNGKDGLWEENVGPSLYAKAQGIPVKIWGFFADGRLEYHVLPSGGAGTTTHMNGSVYEKLIDKRFATWRRACFKDGSKVHLVQDHERCLWQKRNIKALQRAGCHLLKHYPKSSPDLNAIENWWRVLNDRLNETAPVGMETRASFLVRLRRAVAWLNANQREHGRELCTNQKLRAEDVIRLKGARTKW